MVNGTKDVVARLTDHPSVKAVTFVGWPEVLRIDVIVGTNAARHWVKPKNISLHCPIVNPTLSNNSMTLNIAREHTVSLGFKTMVLPATPVILAKSKWKVEWNDACHHIPNGSRRSRHDVTPTAAHEINLPPCSNCGNEAGVNLIILPSRCLWPRQSANASVMFLPFSSTMRRASCSLAFERTSE